MDKKIEELLPFYAMDALTDEERDQVEAYLSAHPEARAEVDEMKTTASGLPLGVTPVEPSPRTKKALMARVAVDGGVGNTKASQPSRRVTRFESIFQKLSFGAAVAAILWAVVLNVQMAKLQAQVSQLNDALVAQSNSLQEINSKISQPSASPVITVSLSGTDVRPDAHGELIANPNSNSAVLVIAGLGQLEAGKTYQVWLIDGGGPQSAGLLTVDANGQGVLIVTSDLTIGSFQALGISVEPDGGSKQPTGEIVVLSDL